MTAPLIQALDATWPAASTHDVGHWRFRDGQGGGKRVSAATWHGDTPDLNGLADGPLVRVHDGQEALDQALAARGYARLDATCFWSAPIGLLTDTPIPPVTAFAVWEPLAIMREMWMQTGTTPARMAVMARPETKTALFCRLNDRPAGVAFAAMHADIVMVHSVEVLPHQHRQGAAKWLMRKAAFWGLAQGAKTIALACVAGNEPAEALYQDLGFGDGGGYHYRIKGDTP